MGFFKKFWDVIKDDLVEAITWFWERGEISKGCNASFVTLIPKKLDPLGLRDYRPISLIDGALIANDTIDFLKVNRKKGIIFKVDFDKAFDSLNRCFLFDVMKCMGFGVKWRNWILTCLKSASVSILVNGSPTNEFSLGRGVRQGDPLSPFLYILAVEGLNILTKTAMDRGLFKGVEVGNDKVLVSHLQYADDTIFFGEWSRINALNLRNTLKCFELSSGLKVNFQKSCVYGVGVDFNEVSYVASFMGCQWRFKTETDSLWVKVIRSIYGLCGGLMLENVNLHSSTLGVWRNIILAGTSIEDLQIPFKCSFTKTIGDGGSTSFWHENWIGGDRLCSLFLRLYRLESVKDATIKDRVFKEADNIVMNWRWIREPTGRTSGELKSLLTLLSAFSFNCRDKDSWHWNLASNGQFTVKKLAATIDDRLLTPFSSQHGTFRNNLVPKKIEVFTRRALKKRIPVRLELDKRGIDMHSVRCPLCDDDLESVDHALIFCKLVIDIWDRAQKWWGLGNFSSFSIVEILNKSDNAPASSFGNKVWQAVRWICVYLIWSNRNKMGFQGKRWNSPMALNEIQIKTFEWISNRAKGRKFDWLT
ncbi:uncharacterized protein [Rutidosis leptorrhynchoides]|uniref:uncharacterized protein n=1 Tax=Rutidosis leptorrhynchoides TaxID=125765 RepID=UPI003A99F041